MKHGQRYNKSPFTPRDKLTLLRQNQYEHEETYTFTSNRGIPRLVTLQCTDTILRVRTLLPRHTLLRHDVKCLRQNILRRGECELQRKLSRGKKIEEIRRRFEFENLFLEMQEYTESDTNLQYKTNTTQSAYE